MQGAKKTWKGGGWVPSPQQLQLRHAVLPAVCRGQRVCVASSLVWVAGGCAPVRPMAVPCCAVLCVEGSKTRLWKSRAVPALGGGRAAACTGNGWEGSDRVMSAHWEGVCTLQAHHPLHSMPQQHSEHLHNMPCTAGQQAQRAPSPQQLTCCRRRRTHVKARWRGGEARCTCVFGAAGAS